MKISKVFTEIYDGYMLKKEDWHLCPQRPNLHGNWTHFPLFNRETEAEYTSCLATDSLHEPKQREIYRQMM